MNRLLAASLAFSIAATSGAASAQTYLDPRGGYDSYGNTYGAGYPTPDRYGQSSGQYDYARVVRVDPVFDRYQASNTGNQRCYYRDSHVGGDTYRDGYYGDDHYNDPYRDSRGSEGGRTVATVIGGVLGAVVGSQVGGGSARYATSAIGSMVGGVAGRQVYDNYQRTRGGTGTVRVCDPVPANGSYGGYATGGQGVDAYDVTYEYAGRRYTTRTNYHPGDRIRVRVDVRPE